MIAVSKHPAAQARMDADLEGKRVTPENDG
jgi:hypothetical protein